MLDKTTQTRCNWVSITEDTTALLVFVALPQILLNITGLVAILVKLVPGGGRIERGAKGGGLQEKLIMTPYNVKDLGLEVGRSSLDETSPCHIYRSQLGDAAGGYLVYHRPLDRLSHASNLLFFSQEPPIAQNHWDDLFHTFQPRTLARRMLGLIRGLICTRSQFRRRMIS